MIKTINKSMYRRTYHNIIKAIYDKPILNGEKMRAFPLRSGIRRRYPFLFNIILEVLVSTIRERKGDIKHI